MSEVSTEIVYRIHIDGTPLEVGGGDSPGLVVIRTVTPEAKEFFGALELTLFPEHAEALAAALLAVAAHEREEDKK